MTEGSSANQIHRGTCRPHRHLPRAQPHPTPTTVPTELAGKGPAGRAAVTYSRHSLRRAGRLGTETWSPLDPFLGETLRHPRAACDANSVMAHRLDLPQLRRAEARVSLG